MKIPRSSIYTRLLIACLVPLAFVLGMGFLTIAVVRHDLADTVTDGSSETATLLFLLSAAGGVILTAICVYVATRSVVGPIRRLATTAAYIASGNDDVEVDTSAVHTPPRHEVDVLEEAVTTMLDRLQQANRSRVDAMRTNLAHEQSLRSTAVKRQFFSMVSREIHEPITSLVGMAETLAAKELDGEARRCAAEIHQTSHSLAVTFSTILDLAKLEADDVTVTEEDFDLDRFLEEVRTRGSEMAARKGLAFLLDRKDPLPACIHGDKEHIRQILLCLIRNGEHAAADGFIRMVASTQGDSLQFDIMDTGPGIPEQEQAHLFDESSGTSTRSTGLGTGLDLPIAKRLALLLGGSLALVSSDQHGSIFRLTVPIKPGDPKTIRRDEAMPVPDMVGEGVSLTPLLELARSIEHLDIRLGLSRVLEQQDVYEQLLLMTRDMTQDMIVKLQNAFTAGDIRALTLEVHSAKGAFANIGAMGLAKQAEFLEHCLQERQFKLASSHFQEFVRDILSFGDKLSFLFSLH